MMDWEQATAKLVEKLDPAHVRPAKAYGPKGDYIEGWHAIAEANRIFGFGGWSYQVIESTCVHQGPREIGQAKKPGFGVTYTARVQVTVAGVIRDDFGAGHGYDVDCGLAHESAVKEAVTDALKRALRSFGNPFGLALYDKSRENVGAPEAQAYDPAPHVAAIESAVTGKALLDVVRNVGDYNSHPAISAARIGRLRALINGAQSVDVVKALAKHFAPDLDEVSDDVQKRYDELTQPKDAA